MSDHSPLPWRETTSPAGTEWIGDASGETVFYSTSVYTVSATTAKRLDNRRLVLASVNLIGPHLDDAERMAVFRAVAGMDADTFGVFLDRIKEVGFLGGE